MALTNVGDERGYPHHEDSPVLPCPHYGVLVGMWISGVYGFMCDSCDSFIPESEFDVSYPEG